LWEAWADEEGNVPAVLAVQCWAWLCRGWGLSEEQMAETWNALSIATSLAAEVFRQKLVAFAELPSTSTADLTDFLHDALTPKAVIGALEAIADEQLMPRRAIAWIEDAVLQVVNRDGCWKT
jgi:hypothetical protein